MSDIEAKDQNRGLFQTERQRQIATIAFDEGRVDVAELAVKFKVTTETVRRDLSDLQAQRLVRRVHGGAVPMEPNRFEPLLAVRSSANDAEKRRIGRMAVQELPESGTIIIDSGSTLLRFAECFPGDSALRVVTNSLVIAEVLAGRNQLEVVVIGGTVQKNTLAMVDAQAVAAVAELAVDTLFISCDGASMERGLSTPYREEAALKRAMISAAQRVVALVDHTKMGQDHFVPFAQWSEIDVFVSDIQLSAETVSQIEAAGPSVLRA